MIQYFILPASHVMIPFHLILLVQEKYSGAIQPAIHLRVDPWSDELHINSSMLNKVIER